jgi:CelD/BcsL family acetyltransferase involved in cellulose biosynthesis
MRLSAQLIDRPEELFAHSEQWAALLARSADNQPTQTPLWLSTWWSVFGARDGRALAALLLRDGKSLVAIAPLCRRQHSYAPGLSFRRIELLASGEAESDEICSDYIGLVAERGRELEIADAVAEALVQGVAGDWDELLMPAMNGESLLPWALADGLRRRGVPARAELSALSPYIPLPSSFDDYLARLSASRRATLRRTLRDFERWAGGRERFELATTPAELERGMAILAELHRQRWESDGKSGAFASEAFSDFHRRVMPALLADGALDLSWLTLDGEPLAAVYSVVHAGRVHFYQSGRKAGLPSKARAGLALQANAIQRAIAAGHREYDFLPGPSQYKLGFALATRPLVALRAARPTLRETARLIGEQMVAGARTLRAAVAPDLQLLQQPDAGNAQKAGDTGLATDLARAVLRRLQASRRALANPLHP